MKNHAWLIVVNSHVARIFQLGPKHKLDEIHTLVHPESRLRNIDLTSDKPGRDFESQGKTRHSLEPRTLPKDHEFALFAKQIAEYLEKACVRGDCQRLYLAASPAILGLLRQALYPETVKLIVEEIDKDITQLPPAEILHHFSQFA